jgi:hypothetical protein
MDRTAGKAAATSERTNQFAENPPQGAKGGSLDALQFAVSAARGGDPSPAENRPPT